MSTELPERLDADLLARIAKGDRRAFELLYDRHSAVLYSVILKILNDPAEAEDILQDAFLQIWDKAGSFDPALGKPLSWTVTVTRNKALDRLRTFHRRQELMSVAGETTSGEGWESNEPLADRELGGLVKRAVEKLPNEQKRAIELAFFTGLSQTEIARALEVPLGTVKARIRRGMLKLRSELSPYL